MAALPLLVAVRRGRRLGRAGPHLLIVRRRRHRRQRQHRLRRPGHHRPGALAQVDLGIPGEHNAQQERQGPGRQQQAQKQMKNGQGLQQQRLADDLLLQATLSPLSDPC